MNLLLTISINPNNVVEEGIGAFFGFLFALLSAGLIAFINRRVEIVKLKSSLKIELSGIKNDLSKEESYTDLFSYSTPFWDSIISTGSWLNFTILARKKSIQKFLNPVGQVYAKIKLLDEHEKSISLTTNEITSTIIQKRKDILNDINNLDFIKPLKSRIKIQLTKNS